MSKLFMNVKEKDAPTAVHSAMGAETYFFVNTSSLLPM